MAPFIDARITLILGQATDAGPADALLIEGHGNPAPGRDFFQAGTDTAHPADCACCTPRNGAGMALARLMLARGRGTGLFFDRVIAVTASPAGENAVRDALLNDPLASAFFKEAPAASPSQDGGTHC